MGASKLGAMTFDSLDSISRSLYRKFSQVIVRIETGLVLK
jgi:hypothetical protein